MISVSKLFATVGTVLCLGAAAWIPVVDAQEAGTTDVIDMHVNLGSADRSIGGSVRAGDSFRIEIDGVGAFEVEPRLVARNPDRFRVAVHRYAEADGSGPLREVEVVDASTGEVVPLRSIPSAAVVIDGVRSVQLTASLAGFSEAPAAAAGRCCVTCSGVKACGCAVFHDCGECCADGCCEVVPVGGGSLARSGSPCDDPIPTDERLAMERLGLAVVRRSAN